MADEADLAFDAEQWNLAQAVSARPRYSPALKRAGYCCNCDSPDVGLRLFCDRDCAMDWEYQDRLRRKLGLGLGRVPA